MQQNLETVLYSYHVTLLKTQDYLCRKKLLFIQFYQPIYKQVLIETTENMLFSLSTVHAITLA